MISNNYDVKQITNYDIDGLVPETISINVPVRTYDENEHIYKIEFVSEDVQYVTVFPNNVDIIKLGYCCEEKGIIYPIFIEEEDITGYQEIQIGKNGIYEGQTENNEDTEYQISIKNVKVPVNIKFKLDYVLNNSQEA